MGKPKGRNGFFYYMIHKQQELKQNGQDWSLNDQRLQQLAGDEWKVMDKERREPFDRKAKAEKERGKSTPIQVTPTPYNQRQENFGRTLAVQTSQIDDESDRVEYLEKMIECCVKACKTKEELKNASFFLISSNVMIKTDSGEFYPLEIGICQYSIKEGIQFTYHQFIDAGKVPIGYMSQAKSWAEDSHKIPLDNFYAASNNYEKIVEDMIQVLNESRFTNEITGNPTPMMVFCNEDQIDQNKGVLEWLAKKYRRIVPAFEWDLEVLDTVSLLYHISNYAGQPIGLASAEGYLTTSAFDYSADTNCEFHDEMDNKNCARGGARRYCFMLSQVFCQIFDVPPTDQHLPPKRNSAVETYKVKLLDIKVQPSYRYQANRNEEADDWAPPAGAERPREEANTSRSSQLGIGRGRGWHK